MRRLLSGGTGAPTAEPPLPTIGRLPACAIGQGQLHIMSYSVQCRNPPSSGRGICGGRVFSVQLHSPCSSLHVGCGL